MKQKIIGHSGHFIDHEDGTATDTRSGLMWMRPAYGQTWENGTCAGEALATLLYKGEVWQVSQHDAKPLRCYFANYRDWRLPTIGELQGLIYIGRKPALDEHVFPSQSGKYFWSTSRSDDPLLKEYKDIPIIISLRHGLVGYSVSGSQREHVRFVRSNKSSLVDAIKKVRDSRLIMQYEKWIPTAEKNIIGFNTLEAIPLVQVETLPPTQYNSLVSSVGDGQYTKVKLLEAQLMQVETRQVGEAGVAGVAEILPPNDHCIKEILDLNGSKNSPWTHFTDNNDGTVTDQRSGLMWMRAAVGQDSGNAACNSVPTLFGFDVASNIVSGYAGRKDWRLPTKNELLSLIESNSTLDKKMFPNKLGVYEYWSDTGIKINLDGVSSPTFYNDSLAYVLLVRCDVVYSISTSITGSGAGVINRSSMDDNYPYGTTVTLTAKANKDSVFKGWGSSANGLIDCYEVTMNSPKRISAEFEAKVFFELQVKSIGDGSGGIRQSTESGSQLQGSVVVLVAEPQKLSKFVCWRGDVISKGAECSVTMDSDKIVSAEFAEIPQFTLTVITIGSGRGTVIQNTKSGKQLQGSVVRLDAHAEADSKFICWHGDVAVEGATGTVTMDSDKIVSAEFAELEEFTLNVMTLGSGRGAVTQNPKRETQHQGSVVKLYAHAEADSKFKCWHGDVIARGDKCTVTMNSSKSVSAEFVEIETFSLVVTATGSGGGHIARSLDSDKYILGAAITLIATADEGSRFRGWHGDTSEKGSVINVTMDSEKTISAEFSVIKSHTLTVNLSGTGHGVVNRSSDAEMYYQGSSVTLTANADAGSTFIGWRGDVSSLEDICTIKMTASVTVTAEFEKLCIADFAIAVEFDSAHPAEMKSGDSAIIFYLNIRNKGAKQARVTLPTASYVNRFGQEVDQNVWLTGLLIGSEGSTIRAGTFRQMGLVFYKERLNEVSTGECLFVTVEQSKPPVTMNFTFRCKHAGKLEFELIKAVSVEKEAPAEEIENLTVLASILKRLDVLDGGWEKVLRKLDDLQSGNPLPRGDRSLATLPPQSLPDVLRWLSTQNSTPFGNLRTMLLPLDLLPSAVIDDINERALNLTGEAALEDDGTTVLVQPEVLLQVIAQWQE